MFRSFLAEYPPATLDAWGACLLLWRDYFCVIILFFLGAGCLIYEVFNGVLHKQEDLARLQVLPRATSW